MNENYELKILISTDRFSFANYKKAGGRYYQNKVEVYFSKLTQKDKLRMGLALINLGSDLIRRTEK